MEEMTAFCSRCNCQKPLRTYTRFENQNVRGVGFSYLGEHAICKTCGNEIYVAELARRIGTTPQNFNAKMKRERFPISDLEYLAETVGCSFERHFVLLNGGKI